MKTLKYLFFSTLFSVLSCQTQTPKINGVSFVASRHSVEKNHIEPLIAIHANYAAVMPFGSIQNLNHPDIRFNSDRQWYGETRKGSKHYINELQKQNIKVMLKPQIWVRHGEFTGKINMHSEENWTILENSYSKFILEYAQLAEEAQVDLFCIGTELEQFPPMPCDPFSWRQEVDQLSVDNKAPCFSQPLNTHMGTSEDTSVPSQLGTLPQSGIEHPHGNIPWCKN